MHVTHGQQAGHSFIGKALPHVWAHPAHAWHGTTTKQQQQQNNKTTTTTSMLAHAAARHTSA
jgi:hypothetical protein